MPVGHDRTVFPVSRKKELSLSVEWLSLLRSACGRSKENISKWDIFVFLNDLSFCALARLYRTILRTQWCHLKLGALTVELKALLLITHSGFMEKLNILPCALQNTVYVSASL